VIGIVEKSVREERLVICKSCPELAKLLGGICKKCGCNMVAKTWLVSAECPLKKWKDEPTE
jgi:hypothetical protein